MPLQDMPGWGEDLNLRRYLRTIITFLLTMRAKDYDMLNNKTPKSTSSRQQGNPDSTDSLQLRHSFTACLYFLPPHRVKPADLVIMAAVSELVSRQGASGCRRSSVAVLLQRLHTAWQRACHLFCVTGLQQKQHYDKQLL